MKNKESLEHAFNNITNKKQDFIKTGFNDFDNILKDAKKDSLIIIASRPSMGKTAFALNITQNITIKQKLPVLIFSIDMPAVQLTKRILCSEAEIVSDKAENGELYQEDWEKIANVMNKLNEAPILIDDTSCVTLSDIKAKARRIKTKHPDLGLIIIDYLQLIKDETNQYSNQVIPDILRGLKSLAHELSTPIVILSQLPRKIEDRFNKHSMLSDLKETGVIEEDVDVIAFIYKNYRAKRSKNKTNNYNKGEAEIIIAKNNYGFIGIFELYFKASIPKFYNKTLEEKI